MAPAPQLSAPGTATYASNTMTVGDGTWDFTKNTFLLPNLVGANFETMRYNGMGNRFSTQPQYHKLILAHGILAAVAFLFLVPAGVFYARFYTRRPDHMVRHHSNCQTAAFVLVLAAFILGNFAVGPSRALSNPHHGIGVAVFLLFILQAIGGRFVKHITRARSLRIKIHQWFGRITAALGIIQVPLGLALYGSPLFLFVLYAIWMAFLALLYFVLDHKRDSHVDRTLLRDHRHSSTRDSRSRVTDSEYITTDITDKTEPSSERRTFKWLAPLAAGAGLAALFRSGRKDNNSKDNRSRRSSRSLSRSSYSRSRGGPEVLPSPRRGSVYESEYTDRSGRTGRTGDSEWTDHTPQRRQREDNKSGSGIGRLLLGVGAALGVQKLVSGFAGRRQDRKGEQAYSEISTATPAPPRRRSRGPPRTVDTISEVTTTTATTDTTMSPAGDRTALAGAYGAAAPRGGQQPPRPRTPRPSHPSRPSRPSHPSHARTESRDSWEDSTFSSDSPSRRNAKGRERDRDRQGSNNNNNNNNNNNKKGILAMLGMGWLARRLSVGRKEPSNSSEYGYSDYDDYRSEARTQYTDDPPTTFRTPPSNRRRTRRYSESQVTPSVMTASKPARAPPVSRFAPPAAETVSAASDTTSQFEPPGPRSQSGGPPMPPLTAGPQVFGSAAHPPSLRSRSESRARDPGHAAMPAMPPDPHGFFYRDDDSSPASPASPTSPTLGTDRRRSRRRRVGTEAAAAAAVATASLLAAEEEQRRHQEAERAEMEHARMLDAAEAEAKAKAKAEAGKAPAHVKMQVHDDRDRNITFRRMTEEEIAESARNRSSSISSDDTQTPTQGVRGYRRDGGTRRPDDGSEHRVTADPSLVTPTPSTVPHAAPANQAPRGRAIKDSAHHSGPSAAAGLHPAGGTTVSSLATSESHQESSAMGSAADRRSRRRQERRRADDSSTSRTVDPNDMFN